MIAVSFDGITLSSPSPVSMGIDFQVNRRVLVSGKTSVQASTQIAEQHTFRCTAEQALEDGTLPAEITSLIAKAGVKGTLTIGAKTVTGCYIARLGGIRMVNTAEWEYEIEFIQETA
jgi:bifunctional N-acetylglucosamine-1-phosphate-uridyltransferase/glucosamine-1-phosphate-acetyltransferase GlmU-like protein